MSFLECSEYAQNIYRLVTIPSQVFGEPAVVKKIDKCMHKSVPLIVGGELAKVIIY